MTFKKPVKRIVTCQGSIQLVTVLSVLTQRENEQSDTQLEYENYLVIYGLYAPPGQIDQFAAFIKKMAELVYCWERIIYISSDQLNEFSGMINSSTPTAIFSKVYELVGIDSTDEIYLAQNWQFGNQLFINAYSSARKICYGDGIGIYYSSNSASFIADLIPIQTLLRALKARFKTISKILRRKIGLTVLESVEFDLGYFTLPDIFGEVPPMPNVLVDRNSVLGIFKKLQRLVDPEYVKIFKEQISTGTFTNILLTSNFSEAGRMTEKNEILAYRNFLLKKGIKPNTVLVIKPHPRDGASKIKALQDSLSDLFSLTLVLSEPELFFLPFEIFFIKALLPDNSMRTDLPIVFAVSSACLSLKFMFGVPSIVGFGKDITSDLFNKKDLHSRLVHEDQLTLTLHKLARSY